MKECRIITVNDGKERELSNGNYLYVCDYPATEKVVNEYLKEGWDIVHMTPVIDPAINREGDFTFYKGGYTFYLEREVL